MLRELRNFLFRGNILDLAIGVILGLAFNQIVQAFANDFLLNLVAAVFGQPDFSNLAFNVGGTAVVYGTTIEALVNFLLIGLVLFLVMRVAERLRFEPLATEEKAQPPSEEVVLLRQIRDALTPAAR
jgi:large conductance mechanosensitive channel